MPVYEENKKMDEIRDSLLDKINISLDEDDDRWEKLLEWFFRVNTHSLDNKFSIFLKYNDILNPKVVEEYNRLIQLMDINEWVLRLVNYQRSNAPFNSDGDDLVFQVNSLNGDEGSSISGAINACKNISRPPHDIRLPFSILAGQQKLESDTFEKEINRIFSSLRDLYNSSAEDKIDIGQISIEFNCENN